MRRYLRHEPACWKIRILFCSPPATGLATSALHPRSLPSIVPGSSSCAAIWPSRTHAAPIRVSIIACISSWLRTVLRLGVRCTQPCIFLADGAAGDLSMSSTLSRQYHCLSFLGRCGSDGHFGHFNREFCMFSSALLCALLTRYVPQSITDFVMICAQTAKPKKFFCDCELPAFWAIGIIDP